MSALALLSVKVELITYVLLPTIDKAPPAVLKDALPLTLGTSRIALLLMKFELYI